MIELVLGGARSGKSSYAEQRAVDAEKKVIYIATAEAGDKEMLQRIEHHRQNRPQHWQTIEEPIKLAQIINRYSEAGNCLLVDCLTLWLANILFNKQGALQLAVFEREVKALLHSLENVTGQLILVSNEVGMGIIAMDEMSRRFVDEAGLLHQQLARVSDKVTLVTAGLPQILK